MGSVSPVLWTSGSVLLDLFFLGSLLGFILGWLFRTLTWELLAFFVHSCM